MLLSPLHTHGPRATKSTRVQTLAVGRQPSHENELLCLTAEAAERAALTAETAERAALTAERVALTAESQDSELLSQPSHVRVNCSLTFESCETELFSNGRVM